SLLPFWVLYGLSNGLYYLLFYVVRYRKQVVLDNLKNAFPEKTVEDRYQIAKKFYRFCSELLVEAIKMRTMRADQVLKTSELLNPEEVYRQFEQQKEVIVVTAHYGN